MGYEFKLATVLKHSDLQATSDACGYIIYSQHLMVLGHMLIFLAYRGQEWDMSSVWPLYSASLQGKV